jgi:hypothetical protein
MDEVEGILLGMRLAMVMKVWLGVLMGFLVIPIKVF